MFILNVFRLFVLSTLCIPAAVPVFGFQSSDHPPVEAPGKLIDLGGWSLHLNCTGPENESTPTVILEAGAGGFSVDWSLVQEKSEESLRICSYDRAGLGWSSPGPRPRTFRQIVWELHTLLTVAEISPPYILAGHSYGGAVSRVFALTYPNDTAGLVLVNSIHELDFKAMQDGEVVSSASTATGRPVPAIKTDDPLVIDSLHPDIFNRLEQVARFMPSRATLPPYDNLPDAAYQMRTWSFGQIKHWAANDNPFESEELKEMMTRFWENEFPLGELPVLVLSQESGDENNMVDESYEEYQAQLLTLSRNSRQILFNNTGHELHLYSPHLVYESILKLASEL